MVMLLDVSFWNLSLCRDQTHLERFAAVSLDKAVRLISGVERFKVGALALQMVGCGAGTSPTEAYG